MRFTTRSGEYKYKTNYENSSFTNVSHTPNSALKLTIIERLRIKRQTQYCVGIHDKRDCVDSGSTSIFLCGAQEKQNQAEVFFFK